MTGTDIDTWKMKRKETYEKPRAVRVSSQELAGLTGGKSPIEGPFSKGCNSGAFASVHCTVGNAAVFGHCDHGDAAMHGCNHGPSKG